MIVVCAWCRKKLGQKEPYDDPHETHGICDECIQKEIASVAQLAERNLGKIEAVGSNPTGGSDDERPGYSPPPDPEVPIPDA